MVRREDQLVRLGLVQLAGLVVELPGRPEQRRGQQRELLTELPAKLAEQRDLLRRPPGQ